ncbi:hypothetical protein EPR50_G00217160 [Perca flavescens]|uniref:Transmembrane protein 273 n=1 Tax=Perca flavescens TaxID=8167 RepID=A0A484C9D8_PERFV|nr:transmembrane protein 273 [Perca flavescens]TDG98277.1 hypothetical protein EPR50_G00217160 [Perca flavescens]
MKKDSQHFKKSVNCTETPHEMIAFQMCGGCLSAVIRAVLITECLLTSVRGDGADSTEKLEIKYALIGGGIGLFLAAGFIIFKFCLIRKHVRDYNTDGSRKTPLETQMLHLGPPSQPEHPVAAVSDAIINVGHSDLQDDVNPANMATG